MQVACGATCRVETKLIEGFIRVSIAEGDLFNDLGEGRME